MAKQTKFEAVNQNDILIQKQYSMFQVLHNMSKMVKRLKNFGT
jgi:hypothetical protein